MRRIIIALILMACIMASCSYSQQEYDEAKEAAYEEGWWDCLHDADISEFDEYRHDEIISYVQNDYMDEILSDDIDRVLDFVSVEYPDELTEYADYIEEEYDLPPEEKLDEDYEMLYVINTESKVFHSQSCIHAQRIGSDHREERMAMRSDLIDAGYKPCGVCNP